MAGTTAVVCPGGRNIMLPENSISIYKYLVELEQPTGRSISCCFIAYINPKL